ncbi:hypothetical protein [Falsiroseomonas sp. CW058]|uniref:hypothetical protein n=1 Tax=Falsiroseomonas sp. CW058 TaxID=3388664 RepID=UPI003D323455
MRGGISSSQALTAWQRGSVFLLAVLMAAVFLPSCAPQTGGMPSTGLRATPARFGTPQQDPRALRPTPVEHQGALTPSPGIAGVVPGNTLILVQPWVGLDRYELRETPVYFASSRQAFSREWANIPWSARGNELCMTSGRAGTCYTAYSDAGGQAYLRDHASGLLARVNSIEPGDSRGVQAAYIENQRRQAAQARVWMQFAGLLAEGLLSGGFGGGGSTVASNGFREGNGQAASQAAYDAANQAAAAAQQERLSTPSTPDPLGRF